MIELLGAGSTLAASLVSTGDLRKVKHAELSFGMPMGIASKRSRNSFRTGDAEVIDVIGPRGMGEIGVDHATAKISAVAGHAIEMVLVGERVELLDQGQILLDCGRDNEHIHASGHGRSDHLAPLRAIAGHAGFSSAVTRQIVLAISFFEDVLDLMRPHNGPVAGIVHAIQVDVEWHDIPLKRLIFAQSRVVAHHRTGLAFAAKAELYRRLWTDAGKIYGAMPGARNSGNTSIERLVENNSNISECSRTRQASEHEHEQKRNQKRTNSPLNQHPG